MIKGWMQDIKNIRIKVDVSDEALMLIMVLAALGVLALMVWTSSRAITVGELFRLKPEGVMCVVEVNDGRYTLDCLREEQ